MKQRKPPLRRCTGCYEMKPKNDLIRIVSQDTNVICFDSTGKMSGRGAYICANKQCLENAYKKKGLERSFKKSVPKEIYSSLEVELERIYEQQN